MKNTINKSRQTGLARKLFLIFVMTAVAGGIYLAGSQKMLSPAKLTGFSESLSGVLTSGTDYTGYGVQVMATRQLTEAKTAMNAFARDGYSAYVLASKNNAGATLYKLRLGPYANKPEASAIHEKVKRRYPKNRNLKSSFVVFKPD